MRKEREREGREALYLESSPPVEEQKKKSVRHAVNPPPPDAPNSAHIAALDHFVMS